MNDRAIAFATARQTSARRRMPSTSFSTAGFTFAARKSSNVTVRQFLESRFNCDSDFCTMQIIDCQAVTTSKPADAASVCTDHAPLNKSHFTTLGVTMPRSKLFSLVARRSITHFGIAALFLFNLLLASHSAWAAKPVGAGVAFPPSPVALPPIVPPQFSITGFIQNATIDRAGSICVPTDPRLAGGTVTLNNITVVIPCNTILQMPALAVTWAELFALVPPGTQADQTGMALQDTVPLVATASSPPYNGPLPSYEITVQGNIIGGKYIAGLVFISQQSLNVGQGIITFIDYDKGELTIAGVPGSPGPNIVHVRFNDGAVAAGPTGGAPTGRYGRAHGSPCLLCPNDMVIESNFDRRFTVDQDNPTVHARTGFPVCIPRFNPFDPANGGDDPLCPQANRPISPNCASLPPPFPSFVQPPPGQYCTSFMMPPPPAQPCPTPGPACGPDPTQQAPLEVGDFIDYLGTLKVDPVTGPYISAHTVEASLGIFTTPGVKPAYLSVEVVLAGTGGLPIANLPQEVTSRFKMVGFTSDPSALVDMYAQDVDPITGTTSDRLISTADPGQPPIVGRFRFQPLAGAFLPATRNYRAVSRTLCGDNFVPCLVPTPSQTFANGLVAGQYTLPNFNFIFAESRLLGAPIPPANFQDLAFLYCGSGPLTTPSAGSNPPVVGQLNPQPWAAPMPTPVFAATLCPNVPTVGGVAAPPPPPPGTIGAPVITTAAAVTTNAGGTVTLTATAIDPNQPPLPVAFNWVQTVGLPVTLLAGGPNGSSVTFTAPTAAGVLTFVLTAANGPVAQGFAQSQAMVNVTVNAAAADTIAINTVTWRNNVQNRGKLTIVATSSLPATTPGLQLFAQASAQTLFVDATGQLQPILVQMSQVPVAMSLVADAPNALVRVCPAGNSPCWQLVTSSVLNDPNNPGLFIPPDTVTVTSTLGGAATATGAQIVIR